MGGSVVERMHGGGAVVVAMWPFLALVAQGSLGSWSFGARTEVAGHVGVTAVRVLCIIPGDLGMSNDVFYLDCEGFRRG